MKTFKNENWINKTDFISPLYQTTDIIGFIQDIKKYLRMNCVDPKGEVVDHIKSIIRKNGIDDPDLFIKKYIFSEELHTKKNLWK